jgi:outer membrane protein
MQIHNGSSEHHTLPVGVFALSIVLVTVLGLPIRADDGNVAAKADGTKTIWTLDRLIEAARMNNRDIVIAEKAVTIAQAQLAESEADLYVPQISLSGSTGYSSNGTRQTTRDATDFNVLPNNLSAGLNASKTIFAGFSARNKVENQKRNLELVRFELNDTVRKVESDVTAAFYNVLVREAAFATARLADGNLATHLAAVEANVLLGGATNIDLLTARVDYKNNVPRLIKARNDLAVAKAAICTKAGITFSDDIVFDGDTTGLERMSFALGVPAADVTDAVIAHDTTLASTAASLDAARRNRETTELSRLPSVNGDFSFRFNFTQNPFYTGSAAFQPSWSIGLGISIPLDDLLPFSKTANLIVEQSETEKQLDLQRLSRIDALKESTMTQLGTIEEQKAAVDAAEESLALAAAKYDLAAAQNANGTIDPLALSDAKLAREEAALSRLQAMYDYATTVWTLEYVTGSFGGK